MRRIVVFGVPVKVHPALPLMLALALLLDPKSYVLSACVFLILHEAAHVCAAKLLHIGVEEMELMPMGGAARIEGLWLLRPSQIAFVVLAGPVLNLTFVATFSAAAWFIPASGAHLAPLIEMNALLFLVNLIPALPLDGGRLFCALLTRRISPERAVRLGVRLGLCLASALLIAAASVFYLRGEVNIMLIMCAAYLAASGAGERSAARAASLMSLLDRDGELEKEGAMPLRCLAVTPEASAAEVARQMRPRMIHRFIVYEHMEPVAVIEERAFLSALLRDSNQTISQIVQITKKRSAKAAPFFHLH